jgi:hypothetical protein
VTLEKGVVALSLENIGKEFIFCQKPLSAQQGAEPMPS